MRGIHRSSEDSLHKGPIWRSFDVIRDKTGFKKWHFVYFNGTREILILYSKCQLIILMSNVNMKHQFLCSLSMQVVYSIDALILPKWEKCAPEIGIYLMIGGINLDVWFKKYIDIAISKWKCYNSKIFNMFNTYVCGQSCLYKNEWFSVTTSASVCLDKSVFRQRCIIHISSIVTNTQRQNGVGQLQLMVFTHASLGGQRLTCHWQYWFRWSVTLNVVKHLGLANVPTNAGKMILLVIEYIS